MLPTEASRTLQRIHQKQQQQQFYKKQVYIEELGDTDELLIDLSIDIPSGTHVNDHDLSDQQYVPDTYDEYEVHGSTTSGGGKMIRDVTVQTIHNSTNMYHHVSTDMSDRYITTEVQATPMKYSMAYNQSSLTPGCISFIQRVSHDMMQQLQDNLESVAYHHYNTQYEDDTLHYTVYCTFHSSPPTSQQQQHDTSKHSAATSTRHTGSTSSHELLPVYETSDVAFNRNGTYLAMTYGSIVEHQEGGWCHHKGAVHIWNMMKTQSYTSTSSTVTYTHPSASSSSSSSSTNTSSLSPDYRIENLECCVMCITWHPSIPTQLAIGLYDGSIEIYDISGEYLAANQQDPRVCRSVNNELTHRESITSLSYHYDEIHHLYVLVSSSSDGQLLIWCIENMMRAPYEGYHVAPKHGVYTGQNMTLLNRYNTLGVTAIGLYYSHSNSSGSSKKQHENASMNSHKSSTLNENTLVLVGTEGGGILRCQLNQHTNKLKISSSSSSSSSAGAATTDPPSTHYYTTLQNTKPSYMKNGEYKWNRDVVRLYTSLDTTAQTEVKKTLVKYCETHNIRVVEMQTLIDAQLHVNHRFYKNPIEYSYTPYSTPIQCLTFHPFTSLLFACISKESSIRIYHLHKKHPILTIMMEKPHAAPLDTTRPSCDPYELHGFTWSLNRPLVFTVTDNHHQIYVFDLLQNIMEPVLTIQMKNPYDITSSSSGGGGSNVILSLTNSPSKHHIIRRTRFLLNTNFLACMSISGVCMIYELGSRLSTLQYNEMYVLERLCKLSEGEENDAV